MNGTETTRFLSLPAAVAIIMALAIIMILDLLENTLVLCILYRQRRRVNLRVANTFLANLSLIYILMGVLLIPFSIVVAINGRNVLDHFACQINGFMNIFVGSASIWTMAVISVDRYRAIVSPPGNRLQSRHARWLLAALWIISLAMAAAPIIFFGKYEANEKSTNCKPTSQSYFLLLSVVCFLIPLATMTFCYVKVFLKVRKQRIQLQAWNVSSSNLKTELKTAKIVFTVLATFIICWLPFVIIYILSTSGGKGKDISPAIFLFSGCLAAAHSVFNPIIYFVMNKTFRNDLMELIPCSRRFHPGISNNSGAIFLRSSNNGENNVDNVAELANSVR